MRVGRIVQDPDSIAQRLRVLMIIADWIYGRGDHGDAADDIDR